MREQRLLPKPFTMLARHVASAQAVPQATDPTCHGLIRTFLATVTPTVSPSVLADVRAAYAVHDRRVHCAGIASLLIERWRAWPARGPCAR
jgi:hypothetical protein